MKPLEPVTIVWEVSQDAGTRVALAVVVTG